MTSGLCEELTRAGLLIAHRPVGLELAATAEAHAVLEPQRVNFISYPYEWCFGQLRDAALLTLDLQERALAHGFTLRDATAYNVQFEHGRPIFIDTLSFEPRQEGAPWAAYKQFCEHFLVPLSLMSWRDIRCGSLLRSHLEGIPLQLGSRLLPRSTWLRPGILMHVHLHAWLVERYSKTGSGARARHQGRGLSQEAAIALVHGLRRVIRGLDWSPSGTEWADYVRDTNYTAAAAGSKRDIVVDMLRGLKAQVAWDLGANIGEYSRAAREVVPRVVAFDVDPAAVEQNYRRVRQQGETGILPLLLDFTNPSPAHGWAHRERLSLEQRGPADVVIALALVHHLAIGRNLPLERIAWFLSRVGRTLLIEFVPKSDSQVQRLLRDRPDIFPDYTREGFEAAFKRHFCIDRFEPIAQSERSLYLMTSLDSELAR